MSFLPKFGSSFVLTPTQNGPTSLQLLIQNVPCLVLSDSVSCRGDEGCFLPWVRCCGGGQQTRLSLLPQPVAFSPDVQDVAVEQQLVEGGRSDDGVPRSSPHSQNPLLGVRMMETRSYLPDTGVKKAMAESRS